MNLLFDFYRKVQIPTSETDAASDKTAHGGSPPGGRAPQLSVLRGLRDTIAGLSTKLMTVN